MNFANPFAWWWAALALPIVILYILKVRMRRVPVSTLMFWQRVFEEKQARSIWQRLRHWFSLLLQLLFLMFLVTALAEPFFDWEILQARRMVLVVDNSASMAATDVEPSRFAQAQQEAHRLIDSLRQRDEMAIIAAGTQPKVVCGFTSHQRTLREALDGVAQTDGPTRVPEAVETARRLIAEHERGEIAILSDGGFKGAAELAEDDAVRWTSFGSKADNVGIEQFQVRRSVSDPLGYQVLVEVANLSEETAELQLELDLDEQIVDVIPLRVEPGDSWTEVFEKTSQEGGELRARLTRHDDVLAVDDEARAILPERKAQRVLLVTEGNLFLQQVFAAQPLVDLTVVPEPPEQIPEGTLVVYHRQVPEQLPPGDALVIQPTASTDLWRLSEKLESPIVAEQDKDSPLMAHVRLDNVLMPEAYRLRITAEAEPSVLVESATGDPLYFAVDRPDGKVAVLTVNLDRGDLPLRTSFPIMVTNALSWFAGHTGELREALAAGAVTDLELPESLQRDGEILPPSEGGTEGGGVSSPLRKGGSRGVDSESSEATPYGPPSQGGHLADPLSSPFARGTKSLILQSPDGREMRVPLSEDRQTTVGPLDRCGLWRLTRKRQPPEDRDAPESQINGAQPSPSRVEGDEFQLTIACNLSNRTESDLRMAEDLQGRRAEITAGLGGRPAWFYLLTVAGLFTAMEWFLYQRRWIG